MFSEGTETTSGIKWINYLELSQPAFTCSKLTVLVSLLLILADSSHYSGVFIVDFEQVNAN